jgi:hypothetical protein
MMLATIRILETALAVVAVTSAVLGVIATYEKVTGKLGSWLQKHVEAGTHDIRHLTEYHLGPNSGNEQLFRKVERLQVAIDELRHDVERELEED